MSKREILELYLTLAPYGGNLEGVRAASWAWFGREPQDLTPDQVALLIALPQSPEARRPDLKPENARIARARVLDRLVWRGLVTAEHAEDAKTSSIPERHAFPALAWQASDTVLAKNEDNADIVSTLDIGLQSAFEDLARQATALWRMRRKIAMMAVDIRTRAVRASVGSASRERPGGWLDLTARLRSPGSTLKPFIYGMAFDDGVAAPATRISDLPRRFANYRPENFDRNVSRRCDDRRSAATFAQCPSGCRSWRLLGPKRFAAALNFAGAPPSLPDGADVNAGLALALGGAGMRLQDLALIYAALGDDGKGCSIALGGGIAPSPTRSPD